MLAPLSRELAHASLGYQRGDWSHGQAAGLRASLRLFPRAHSRPQRPRALRAPGRYVMAGPGPAEPQFPSWASGVGVGGTRFQAGNRVLHLGDPQALWGSAQLPSLACGLCVFWLVLGCSGQHCRVWVPPFWLVLEFLGQH